MSSYQPCLICNILFFASSIRVAESASAVLIDNRRSLFELRRFAGIAIHSCRIKR